MRRHVERAVSKFGAGSSPPRRRPPPAPTARSTVFRSTAPRRPPKRSSAAASRLRERRVRGEPVWRARREAIIFRRDDEQGLSDDRPIQKGVVGAPRLQREPRCSARDAGTATIGRVKNCSRSGTVGAPVSPWVAVLAQAPTERRRAGERIEAFENAFGKKLPSAASRAHSRTPCTNTKTSRVGHSLRPIAGSCATRAEISGARRDHERLAAQGGERHAADHLRAQPGARRDRGPCPATSPVQRERRKSREPEMARSAFADMPYISATRDSHDDRRSSAAVGARQARARRAPLRSNASQERRGRLGVLESIRDRSRRHDRRNGHRVINEKIAAVTPPVVSRMLLSARSPISLSRATAECAANFRSTRRNPGRSALRKRDGLEAAHELLVGPQRIAGQLRADAHERDAQLVSRTATCSGSAPARAPCPPADYAPRR